MIPLSSMTSRLGVLPMIRVVAFALLLAPAWAWAQPCVQYAPQTGCLPHVVIDVPAGPGGYPQTVTSFGGGSTAVSGPGTPTQTSVTVPANTSTSVIGTNATRRSLVLIPSNTSCTVNPAGGAASATSMPIPGGWNWTQADPPPATAVAAFCTTAATVSVTEMH